MKLFTSVQFVAGSGVARMLIVTLLRHSHYSFLSINFPFFPLLSLILFFPFIVLFLIFLLFLLVLRPFSSLLPPISVPSFTLYLIFISPRFFPFLNCFLLAISLFPSPYSNLPPSPLSFHFSILGYILSIAIYSSVP